MSPQHDTASILPKDTTQVLVAGTAKQSPDTGDSITEYWVTRVVRQMKGCSPSRIDSVIQANLPPRKIRWSQRPDTLEIPGLPGRVAYTTNLPLCYELGFFKDNLLMHAELTVSPPGMPTDIKPQTLRDDNILGTIIILCIVLLSALIHGTRTYLAQQAGSFFLTPNRGDLHHNDNATPGIAHILLTYLLIITTGSILLLNYAQGNYNLFLCHITQYSLLAIYTALFTAFFLLKWVLSAFINWIFFDKTSRQEWRNSYNFLLLSETTILLPIITLGIYLRIAPENLLCTCILVELLFKIALLYKTQNTFLLKIYCFLHLLSYLCALEIIPLLMLWVSFTGITESLITIF